MVLVRGLVYLITGGAPVGDDGMPSAFIAFGSERLLGIHYLVSVPSGAARRAVLRHAHVRTFWAAHLYATGGNREAAYLSGVPDRSASSRSDLCLVRWARGRRLGVMLAARPQSGRPTAGEFYEADRHRRRGAGRRLAAGRVRARATRASSASVVDDRAAATASIC